jgi:AcrR family transcriptional regulator
MPSPRTSRSVTAAPARTKAASPRRQELLERSYAYVLAHGLVDMSLRPLAKAVGSSPRVLLFLFGSKDGLVRALLARAREDELKLLVDLREHDQAGLYQVAGELWRWLAAPAHRGVLILWTESYARALAEPEGPWGGFAAATVEDWLALLADAQPPHRRQTGAGERERTVVLALLRGGLLDLLATGDELRTTAALNRVLSALSDG